MCTVWFKLNLLLMGCLWLNTWAAPPNNRLVEEVDPELTAGYFQGDMEVQFERNGELSPTLHWPNATVYYKIDKEFDAPHATHIELAMRLIERVSCIRFLPATKDTLDYVLIAVSQAGCSSMVGYQGGKQNLKLAIHELDSGCFRLGTIQHELLHTLGFRHQQCSPNRDEYVRIVEENIIEGKEKAFLKYPEDRLGDFGQAYDYGSILHYGPKGFSSNGEVTIVALRPEGQDTRVV